MFPLQAGALSRANPRPQAGCLHPPYRASKLAAYTCESKNRKTAGKLPRLSGLGLQLVELVGRELARAQNAPASWLPTRGRTAPASGLPTFANPKPENGG